MSHNGKHIIDPETGLCEICDKDAIEDLRQGKRPAKHVYHRNSNEMPYSNNQRYNEIYDEPSPPVIRRAAYPPPPVQPRRVAYDEGSQGRPKPYYYVDRESQIYSQKNSSLVEPPRRYIIQDRRTPPEEGTVHVMRRRIRTPEPVSNQPYRSGPRRQINSDTGIIERQHRLREENSQYLSRPAKTAIMYSIEAVRNDNRDPLMHSPRFTSQQNDYLPARTVYPGERNGRLSRLEPEEHEYQVRPSPTVVRRVYKRAPPTHYEQSYDDYDRNGNHLPAIRRGGRNRGPSQTYSSNPEMSHKSPTIHYIRSVNRHY